MRKFGWVVLLLICGAGFAQAEGVFVNGSFESGDYAGWTLSEAPEYWEDPSTMDLWDLRGLGTWGVCQNGEVIEFNGKLKKDYCDILENQLFSPTLPKACNASEGVLHSFQLQDAAQIHTMYQDIQLPANAKALAWEMSYKNHNSQAPFFRNDQRIKVSLKNLSGQEIKTLFLTDDTKPVEVPTWATYSADVSQYAGSTVRFEVEVTNFWERLDAYFDNFRVELAATSEIPLDPVIVEPPVVEEPPPVVPDPVAAPPGWWKNGKDKPKGLEKKDKDPKGFSKGTKSGW